MWELTSLFRASYNLTLWQELINTIRPAVACERVLKRAPHVEDHVLEDVLGKQELHYYWTNY